MTQRAQACQSVALTTPGPPARPSLCETFITHYSSSSWKIRFHEVLYCHWKFTSGDIIQCLLTETASGGATINFHYKNNL